jgi:hypothetical protein
MRQLLAHQTPAVAVAVPKMATALTAVLES